MAINKETIISVFDDKLTLMQWLKSINKALEDAVLTGVEVRQKGNATFSFVVNFEDGSELESNEFILAQGESINGATIRNGHLYLSLTNGDELDAGNLKLVTSFEINASQHLIVNYSDETSQDLGTLSDFSNADFVAKTLKASTANWKSDNLTINQVYGKIENIYTRVEEINNVLYVVSNFKIKNETENPITLPSSAAYVAYFSVVNIPSELSNNIYDLNGFKVSETTEECLITSCEVEARRNTTRSAKAIDGIKLNILNSSNPNSMHFFMKVKDNIEIPSGESIVCSIRTFLTLLWTTKN